jgi:hypothetical protein
MGRGKLRRSVALGSVRSRLLAWLLVGAVLILIFWIFFPLWPPDPRCAVLAVLPEEDAAIPIPTNCTQSIEAPGDEMTSYLEKERQQRGLIFKKWITCRSSSQMPNLVLNFEHDKRWLASYKPLSCQFRRTVVVLPYAQPIPEGSPVIAEICLMPRRKYILQIAGECNGKFAVGK